MAEATTKTIGHRVHPCGSHSLGYESERGRRHIGVVLPGRHEFGPARHNQRIQILEGSAKINGRTFTVADGDRCLITRGEKIVVEVQVPTPYFCKFFKD